MPQPPDFPNTTGREDADGRMPFRLRLVSWGRIALSAVGVILLGVLLGQQYWSPNKRTLPVIAAVILAGVAWRLDLVTSIGILILLLPYPKSNIFGNTNLALAALVGGLWLVNSSLRRAPPPRHSPIDLPLVGLVIIYICSFYNVQPTADYMIPAVINFELFIGCILVYYIIIANVNSPMALARVHVFQLICATSVFLIAAWEINHPGFKVIPGWIDLSGSTGTGSGEEFSRHNVRIGATFGDYELLSEYCVMTVLLAIFFWARAATKTRRILLSAFILLDLFIMFATVTRGAIVSLAVGIAVLLWTTRRRLKFVPLAVGLTLGLLLFIGMNFYVAHYTHSGDMFARLSKTTFEGGIPDSRVGAWRGAWGRAMLHPIIGQGPYYAPLFGFGFVWPHNVYLYYANIVGFTGLAFFLWILARFWKVVQPGVDSLTHPDYARAYQVVTLAQFVAFVVNEFKIDYLRNPVYQTVVWAMFSVWTATYFIAQQQAAARAQPAALARAA